MAIVVSAFSILFSFFTQLNRINFIYDTIRVDVYELFKSIYEYTITFVVIYLLTQFFITLLMIFMRFKILFDLGF